MELARYVVEAVVLEGRSCRDVASSHGVSKSWVAKMVSRYRQGGYEALAPRSKAAHNIPHRTPPEMEDKIIKLRKQLQEQGFDAGAQTIHYHLQRTDPDVPSVPTIWRVLRRRGFVVPQPHKRPKSSWIRFEAQLPNECWQSDVTFWRLADGSDVEICNFIDDHSRLVTASKVLRTTRVSDVVKIFIDAGSRWGFPASVLTDNGCVYTSWHRGGANAMQTELLKRGIEFKHSRPYHPQTCGKVERFHQTLKRYLSKQPVASSTNELQAQVDRFVSYYNEERPHRARGKLPPRVAFDARDKARPLGKAIKVGQGVRVRVDRIDNSGKVTLRHRSRLHHIGVGRAYIGQRITMLIDGLDIRVISQNGEPIRRLTLDPTKDYQPTGKPRSSSKMRRKLSTMP